MRVTTDFWVSALVRRVFGSSGFATVLKRGATEAGAVFVITRGRMGDVALYAPAPQTSYDQARPDDRHFLPAEGIDDEEAADKRLERERRFDPDIWVVEIEPGTIAIEELLTLTKP